mmetsp:Transcript_3567/g.8936  ORF Transcript_3567/g.8936 Transcript_3567/m.8936 type:complete len:358 (+) Transcript_3567:74-1147(+)
MSVAKKTALQMERERQERLDLANAKRERTEITKALQDLAVMRDVKNYLMRKGILDEEGRYVDSVPSAGIMRKGSTQSVGSEAPSEGADTPRPRAHDVSDPPGEASVMKLVRGGKLSGKSLRFQELSVHRNFSTWGAVPPQLLRLLYGELCPGQLNFHALKASYSNMHQKEISRAVADQLFEYLTGQRKEACIVETRDLPSLLKQMEAWHAARGSPGLYIDGRCDFRHQGVYKIEKEEEEEKGSAHVRVTDRIRQRTIVVALSLLENVSCSSLFVQTNYSDRHATIESIERESVCRNVWDMFSDSTSQSSGAALAKQVGLQTPVSKRRRMEETVKPEVPVEPEVPVGDAVAELPGPED